MARFENTTRTGVQSTVKVEHEPGEGFVELTICTQSGTQTARIDEEQLQMIFEALRIADGRLGSATNG